MLEKGLNQNIITYNTLIRGRCKQDDVLEALNLYNELLEKGLEPSDSSYTPLISRLCKEDKIQDAMELFDEMLKRGLIPLSCTHDDLVLGHCQQADIVEAMHMFNRMLQSRLKPGKETFRVLMRGILVGMSLSLLLWRSQTVEALYGPSSDVLLLSPSTCKSKVINSDGIVLVGFFAPWCGHYQALTPIWEKTAAILKGLVIVAALNVDAHRNMESRGFQRSRCRHCKNLLQSGRKQLALERAVGVSGCGYPAVIALNINKGVYAPFHSAFEPEHLVKLVNNMQRPWRSFLSDC